MKVSPYKLMPDNFTPPTRTPWGGRKIRQVLKGDLELPPGFEVVGESWEASVEPDFPSRLQVASPRGGHDVKDAPTLAKVIADNPSAWLGGPVAARYSGQTPLLVKLLDSADNLSVQVHPHDGDPKLAPDESGKPESWIVLDAEQDAGLYLGFKVGIRRADVASIIREGGDLSEVLNFVPVKRGDAFVISAGTPHAIGAGVTLVEPQFVTPGRRGKTYRFWDWNRYYDADGKRSTREQGGALRELHVERSLEVTDWGAPRGSTFVQTCRALPVELQPGRTSIVDWSWFRVERWRGTRTLRIGGGDFWALSAVDGTATVTTSVGTIELARGESGVIPAAAGPIEVLLEGGDVIATTHAES